MSILSSQNHSAEHKNATAALTQAGAGEGRSAGGAKKKSGFSGFVYRFGKKNWVIVGAVLIVGLAVWLNWSFFDTLGKEGYAGYQNSSGMVQGTGADVTDAAKTEKDSGTDYFATAEVSRKRARDESMEVLQGVIDNTGATEEVKNEALSEMSTIAGEIEKEANIEALLLSKGFDDCLAVLNGNNINVVVRSAGSLEPAQIAQINAVVYEQTGIEPVNITIVHKN